MVLHTSGKRLSKMYALITFEVFILRKTVRLEWCSDWWCHIWRYDFTTVLVNTTVYLFVNNTSICNKRAWLKVKQLYFHRLQLDLSQFSFCGKSLGLPNDYISSWRNQRQRQTCWRKSREKVSLDARHRFGVCQQHFYCNRIHATVHWIP